MNNVKIVTFVPINHADEIRQALGEAGAGVIGEYSFCSYSLTGKGRFLPGKFAHPHIGTDGVMECVDEERVEVVCSREKAKAVIRAIKKAHPYEEVALDIYSLIDESEL